MEIKSLETKNELHDALWVNKLAWKEAYRDLLPEGFIEGMPIEPPNEQVEEVFDTIGGDDEVFLIAVDDTNTINGYIYLRWGSETKDFVGKTEAGLKEIYVHPDYWGQGIGTALLNDALEMVPSSIEAVRLEMLSGNKAAHEFYLARDFKIDGKSEFPIAGESYPTDIYVCPL